MFSIGEFSHIARVTARQLRHYEEIVAAFGVVNWVKNLRVAGEAQFIRGRRIEMVRVRELGQVEAAPILKKFLKDFGRAEFGCEEEETRGGDEHIDRAEGEQKGPHPLTAVDR